MGVLNEAAIERAVKKNGEIQAQLLAAQLVTNQWLQHIAKLLEQQQEQAAARWAVSNRP